YAMEEKNFILEDDGKYGAATMSWNQFLKGLQKQLDNPKMKPHYFDGYFYSTRTLFKYALHDPACKNKEKVMEIAAKRIIDLQFSTPKEGWELEQGRFEELLKAEPMLNQIYQQQKKARLGK